MHHSFSSNPLDLFEIEEPELFSQHNSFSKRSNFYSSIQICQQQQQPGSTHQQVNDKLMSQQHIHFQKFQYQNQEQNIQDNQEDDKMDFIEGRKGKGKWEDRLEISKTIMIFHEVNRSSYAYQLEFYQDKNQQIQFHPKVQMIKQQPRQKQLSYLRFPKALDRRMRVERYLQKKARRCFIKKVSYACRKVVADQRMRVKGRFVTKQISDEIIQKDIILNKKQTITNEVKKEQNIFRLQQ